MHIFPLKRLKWNIIYCQVVITFFFFILSLHINDGVCSPLNDDLGAYNQTFINSSLFLFKIHLWWITTNDQSLSVSFLFLFKIYHWPVLRTCWPIYSRIRSSSWHLLHQQYYCDIILYYCNVRYHGQSRATFLSNIKIIVVPWWRGPILRQIYHSR